MNQVVQFLSSKSKDLKAKEVVWLLGAMICLGVILGSLSYFTFSTSQISRRIPTTTKSYPYVFVHVTAGVFWVICGFLQFTKKFQTNMRLHKINGYLYFFFALTSVFSLLMIHYKLQLGAPFGIGSLPMSLHSLLCLFVGYILIKKKNVLDHRAWMLRSMVMAVVMPADRFFDSLLFAFNIPHVPMEINKIIIVVLVELIIFKKLEFNILGGVFKKVRYLMIALVMSVAFFMLGTTTWLEHHYVHKTGPFLKYKPKIEDGLEHLSPQNQNFSQ